MAHKEVIHPSKGLVFSPVGCPNTFLIRVANNSIGGVSLVTGHSTMKPTVVVDMILITSIICLYCDLTCTTYYELKIIITLETGVERVSVPLVYCKRDLSVFLRRDLKKLYNPINLRK